MKKIFIILITMFSFFESSGQSIPVYNGKNFQLKIENGARVEQKLLFLLDREDYIKIKNSSLFKQWREITWANPENKSFINNHKGWDEVLIFLNEKVISCSIDLQFIKLKNGTSLKFIEKSKGLIFMDDEGEISISFPFEAQNGYGYSVISKVIYSVEMNEGKPESSCFIID